MISIETIRKNPQEVKTKSKQKLVDIDIDRFLVLDKKRNELIQDIESHRAERNKITEQIAKSKSKPSDDQLLKSKDIKSKIETAEEVLKDITTEWQGIYIKIPNMPTDDTPVGKTEDENVVVKTWGEIPKFGFTPKSESELTESRNLTDKKTASKIAGSRFAYIKGPLVRLQFALLNFVFDTIGSEQTLQQIITENGLEVSSKPFMPVLPPPMLNTETYKATARLDGSETTYKLEDDDLWLNASAEHTLCCYFMNTTLEQSELPIRFIGYGTAFRREAGTYGKDMDGIFRLHHFDKAEMQTFSLPEQSRNEHLLLVAIQEYLVQQLKLPYELLLKCTADIGDPNARGMDINIWMPSQNKYRETHTADLITDYQTRRLKTKVKYSDGHTDFAHTNDATAFAMGRILKAIVENYQNEDGSINVPEVLVRYMNGQTTI